MTSPLTLVSLPLFPLHTVLFPGGTLSLQVFEPRYRSMVRCCREQDMPFGIVTLLDGEEVQRPGAPAERFHPVGTIARIDSVTPQGDGVERVACRGVDRFRIQQTRKLASGQWVADAQLLPADAPYPIPDDLQHSAATLQQVWSRLSPAPCPPAGAALWADCSWVANHWCELLPMDPLMQLQWLQVDSPLLRLELVTDALEQAGIVLPQHTKT